MYDALQVLQTLFTTSTGYSSTAVDLKTATPRRGLKARVIVPAISSVGTAGIVTFSIEHSSDNTTFTEIARADPITNAAAAVEKVLFIPFDTSKRYVRLAVANTVSTGTPSIAYKADLGIARPG